MDLGGPIVVFLGGQIIMVLGGQIVGGDGGWGGGAYVVGADAECHIYI